MDLLGCMYVLTLTEQHPRICYKKDLEVAWLEHRHSILRNHIVCLWLEEVHWARRTPDKRHILIS